MSNRGRPPGGQEKRDYVDAELAHWGIVRSTDAQGRARYEVTCGECGKHDSKSYPHVNNPEDVLKLYRNQGWIFGYHESPFHTTGCKRSFERKQKFKRKEEMYVMKTPADSPVVLVDASADPPSSPPIVTSGDPKITREIVTLLNDYFDTKRCLYEVGWSDARVAKQAGTSEEYVKRYRVAAYGELAEDPTLTKLREDIAATMAMLKDLERRLEELRSRVDYYVGHKAAG